MTSAPRVAVLVLTHNGRAHLEHCLPSLDALAWRHREIVVVDNASTDGSTEYVRRAHPAARVMRFDRNLGFAAAYNDAIAAVDAEWVALLNDDTRVLPDWLDALLDTAGRHGADAVASRILDWDGRRVDFDGALLSLEAHGWQRHHGTPVGPPPPESPQLFACAGAMLIRRQVFLEAGGFDPDYFAYFEDVDLGWRLTLQGHTVMFSPAAVVHHRLHGTGGAVPFAQRLRLYERNALATLYKNYEDATLHRVLPAAVALTLVRALHGTAMDQPTCAGPTATDGAHLEARTAGHLRGLEDFGQWLPRLQARRVAVQARPRRSDADVLALFGAPRALHAPSPRYGAIARALWTTFELDALVDAPPEAGRHRLGTPAPSARAGPPPLPAIEVGAGTPLVSIVIPTVVGAAHLHSCFTALRAQGYPPDRVETVVIDNGAPGDLAALVAREAPAGRVLAPGRNLGFGGANNLALSEARGDYVAFLNDDTRPDPGWLGALVDVARRRRAAAVASYVVSWDGEEVDFAGGDVNFEGKGFQHHAGARAGAVTPREAPLLFANGAAMLAHRATLVDAGGWNPRMFMYYEDVELGWRLWLLGHEVWMAPRAVVRHRHHGSSGRWPTEARTRLLEHHALAMLCTLLDTDNLARVLPAALLLALDRAWLETSLHRGATAAPRQPSPARPLRTRLRDAMRARGARRTLSFAANVRRLGARGLLGAARDALGHRGSAPPPGTAGRDAYAIEAGPAPAGLDAHVEPIAPAGAARLAGLADLLRELPALATAREALQARRRRSDVEILGRFAAHWLDPVPSAQQPLHDALHATLVRLLDLDAVRGSGAPGAP